MCTPSRSSLMTGKYPSNVGMQHFVIGGNQPWALGLDQKLLPEYLKEVGYKTHLVGKWHLGWYQQQYTPTNRGFESHFGYYVGAIDYYNHSYNEPVAINVKNKNLILKIDYIYLNLTKVSAIIKQWARYAR